VRGLKTIVAIAGVASYYNVFNSDGAWFGPSGGGGPGILNERAQKLCQPWNDEQGRLAGTDGSFNRYWQSQDYSMHAGRIHASVFQIQGFNDLNVRPIQFGLWWAALTKYNVTRKAWLHQAGHTDPFDLQRPEFVSTLHRWFDRYLLGVDNGIDREPAIHIEHDPDHWVDESQWPPAGTHRQTLWTAPGDTAGLGTLEAAGPAGGTEQLTDDQPQAFADTWPLNPTTPSGIRVLFTSRPVSSPTRLAGTGSVTVTVRSNKPMARVGAQLVDYGPATVRNTFEGASGIHNLSTTSCWGQGSTLDSACYLDTAADLAHVDHQIIASGWADIGHYRSLWHGVALKPGKAYPMTLQLSTMDHIVAPGHRIALVIGGTDGFWFTAPTLQPTLTFELHGTSASIPVASGSF